MCSKLTVHLFRVLSGAAVQGYCAIAGDWLTVRGEQPFKASAPLCTPEPPLLCECEPSNDFCEMCIAWARCSAASSRFACRQDYGHCLLGARCRSHNVTECVSQINGTSSQSDIHNTEVSGVRGAAFKVSSDSSQSAEPALRT